MKLIRLFLFFALITAFTVEAQSYMNIKLFSGSGQSCTIASIRTLNFSKAGDLLQIKLKSGSIITDTLAFVRKITFDNTGNGTPLNVGELPTAHAARYDLLQNYPNPFNPTTVIKYELASAGKVQLTVYNILGKEVATLVNQEKAAGQYTVEFDARNMASGIYFYKLTTGNVTLSKKMLVIK